MKKIISLTRVFTKEFYQNLPIFDKEKKKFNKKSIFFWLIAIVFLGIIYVSYQIINFLIKVGQPEIFLNVYFFILAMLLLFQSILISANLYFFSKDIEKILHMPIKPEELLLAKFNTLLGMLYITEGVVGLVPITFYGLLTNANFLFYFWEIIILMIFPILIALVVSILILLLMRFAKFVHNKEIFQLILTFVLIILFCMVESKIVTGLLQVKSDEQALQQITSFSQKAEQVGKNFFIINPSITILTKPTDIKNVLEISKLIIYNIMVGIIFIVIGKATYLKDILRNMISNSYRKRKKVEIDQNRKKYSIQKTYILKEIKMLLTEPIYFMQCIFPVAIILITGIIVIAVLMPIMIQVLQDETIRNAVQSLSFNMEIVCYILILLQVLFSISNISLTSVSREGKDAVFMKYIPIKLYYQFVYKNIPQIMLNFIVSIVILGIIWYIVPQIKFIYLFMILIISILINLINSYLMLIVDLRRPNLNWDTEYTVVKKSENKFFQYAFMIINVLFLMYIAKILEDVNMIGALIGEIIIFAIIFVIIDRCVKKWQHKLFNKIK